MGGGGGHEAPHHHFVVIAPMIMKFGTGVNLDVFYTMVAKNLWRHYFYDDEVKDWRCYLLNKYSKYPYIRTKS